MVIIIPNNCIRTDVNKEQYIQLRNTGSFVSMSEGGSDMNYAADGTLLDANSAYGERQSVHLRTSLAGTTLEPSLAPDLRRLATSLFGYK